MTTVTLQQPDSAAEQHSSEFPKAIEDRVSAYLHKLGLRDPALIKALTDACLHRASRRAAPGGRHELLRRALEEAQRRFDNALGQSLNLHGSKNAHALAAARAAILLEDTAVDTDHLMRAPQDLSGAVGSLDPHLPRATPPESRLSMHEQPISFFFSRSSQPRK